MTTSVSHLSNAMSYIYFQDDKLIFLFKIFTKVMNTSFLVGKLDFNLIILISGPTVLISLNLFMGWKYCLQSMSYFYLEMNTFVWILGENNLRTISNMKNVFASIKWFLLVAYVSQLCTSGWISLWLCGSNEKIRDFFFFASSLTRILLENLCCPQSPLVCLLLQKGSVPWDYSYFIPLHFVLLLYRSKWSHIENLVLASRFVMLHTDVGGLLLMWCGVLGRAVFEKRRKDTGRVFI